MAENDTIRVLIVDDEDRFRATMSKLLRNRGFEVADAAGGVEAIEIVKKGETDVVVLDVRLHGMDGNTALREIKKIRPEVEVIMLAACGGPDSALPGLRDGVFDYLSKPCDIEVLADKICAAYAGEKRVADELRLRDIMVPLSHFSVIHEDRPASEAIEIIHQSYLNKTTTETLREAMHRCALVLDKNDKIVGVLTFTNLLQGLRPQYVGLLVRQHGSSDPISVKPLSCPGMFTLMIRDLPHRKVHDLMSEPPPKISADVNLMDVVNTMLSSKAQRLLVEENGKIIGVVREQDLFFRMVNVLSQHNK